MIEQDLKELELSIEHATKAIDQMKALDRLYHNKDFQSIIVDGYFKDEASRLVLLKGDVNIEPESEAHCDKMINGIGCLRAYFQIVNHFGTAAQAAIEEDRNTRQELLQTQLAGDEE